MAQRTRRTAAIQQGMRWGAERGRLPGRRSRVPDDAIRQAMRLPKTVAEQARSVGLSKQQFIARRRRIEKAQEELEHAV